MFTINYLTYEPEMQEENTDLPADYIVCFCYFYWKYQHSSSKNYGAIINKKR